LAKAACELKIEPKSLSPDVLNHLLLRDWPGNVRELENTIRGWSATIPDEKIQMRHVIQIPKNDEAIQPDIPFEGPYKELKERVIESFTRSYVTRLLENTGGNISFSARVSGIKRQSLQKIINRYNINADDYRQDQTE
ncbi:MAG: sigma-54-dependent Fis family transcriptional regulator, partial [Proteobacteria bacterium]|nr:sigma-54-dependent Fis family transcriptional regulator [Pseudomonadota bacterium]